MITIHITSTLRIAQDKKRMQDAVRWDGIKHQGRTEKILLGQYLLEYTLCNIQMYTLSIYGQVKSCVLMVIW